MKTNLNEEEYFDAFRLGDEESYVTLFHRFYRSLCLFGLQFGISREEAEEAAQDVLLQLWYKRSDFDSFSKMSSFLCVSMRNATFNTIDKNKRIYKNQERYFAEASASDALSEEQFKRMVYAETLAQLHTAFQKLPNQCSEVMRMLFLEGHTVAEVAETLAITPSTVYVQKKKGVDQLRSILKAEDYFLITLLLAGYFKN